jgi:Ca2+-transporting ATPase
MEWHTLKEEQIFKHFKSSKEGLNEEEARGRLKVYGKNELRKIRRLNALKILFSQFTSFLIIILIIAAVISLLLGHKLDFFVILAIIVLNSLFGFFQEYKAEKAIEKLKEVLVPEAKIIRNGKIDKIDARTIVPGDILVLEEGDKIMADARIISSESLQVNEAALTGESVAEDKKIGVLKLEIVMADRTNMIYQGTEIVKGKGKAIVISTGMKTEFGKVAELVQKVKPEKNPLKEKLDIFARNLGIIALVLIGLISLIGFLFGFDKFQIFLTAVSLAVSVIPEGLPAVMTICLALATQRMLKVKSLIRKLPAAETLGRASFICTDKTGTITEEKMEVRKIYVNGKSEDKFKKNSETGMLFKIGILCNNARKETRNEKDYIIGDPTEKALLLAADKQGLSKKKETEAQPRIKEFPFSSERKMMSIVRENKRGYVSYIKGAPEVIVKRCNAELIQGKIRRIDDKRRKELVREYEKLASEGLRVLGFAYKSIIKRELDQEQIERNLIFVGLQGMIDPPRKEVKKAIKQCNDAGIKVLMITGDSALTAKAVGKEIGLEGKVITAEQLKKMSDEKLSKEIYHIAIFARVSPQDKLRVIEALKRNEEIVAVTGDGINDAPALKKADIGIAVGRGTDVAKDSSDIILLDNDFASIVKAVKEGRRVYDNIKKFVKYMLSANTNEVSLIVFAILLSFFIDGFPLPLLPLQILWLNLLTDSLPALALSTEKAESEVMKRKPIKEGILKGTIKFIVIAGILAFIISFLVFYLYLDNLNKARTMAATTSVLFQMFLVFNCKTKKSFFKSEFNKYIGYAVVLSIALHLVVMYTPLNIFFNFVFLGLFDWLKITGLCIVTFIILEGVKLKMR